MREGKGEYCSRISKAGMMNQKVRLDVTIDVRSNSPTQLKRTAPRRELAIDQHRNQCELKKKSKKQNDDLGRRVASI